jgi:hypothetical protein
VTVRAYRARTLQELETALGALLWDGMEVNFQGGLSLAIRQLIVDFAATHRRPGDLWKLAALDFWVGSPVV